MKRVAVPDTTVLLPAAMLVWSGAVLVGALDGGESWRIVAAGVATAIFAGMVGAVLYAHARR